MHASSNGGTNLQFRRVHEVHQKKQRTFWRYAVEGHEFRKACSIALMIPKNLLTCTQFRTLEVKHVFYNFDTISFMGHGS